jgi:hypothetical protein
MADADRLQTLAQACVQAAHDVEDTDTAAMLLESARRFLERGNPWRKGRTLRHSTAARCMRGSSTEGQFCPSAHHPSQ